MGAYQFSSRSVLLAQLLAHLRMPLYRNGYALILGVAATSALGVAYWALAARVYSPEVVGASSAVISAMMLLTGVAMLSLSGVLVRFIPLAGTATTRLILAAYAISVGTSVVVGVIFCWGIDWWAPTLHFLRDDSRWTIAFVSALVIWSIFALQDSALTGLRQSIWIPLENISFAIIKIGLLALFGKLLPVWGIFIAWVLPVLILVPLVNYLIFGRLLRTQPLPNVQLGRATPRAIGQYIAGNYPGTLFFLASTTLLPLIVAEQAGVRATAYFFMPWMIVTGLFQVALQMATSLTVEAVADQRQAGLYCYRALRQSARMVFPAVVLLVVGAAPLLTLFGPDYAAEGALLLRLAALAALPNMPVMLYIGYARVRNRVGSIIFFQGVQALPLLAMSYFWLEEWGITSIGLALLLTQSSAALLVLLTDLRTVLQQGRQALVAS
jgi:hypothetical protein